MNVVLKDDEDAGKIRAFWSAGASAKTQFMFVETFDVISGDFHCGNFVWVSHVPRCTGCVCSVMSSPPASS